MAYSMTGLGIGTQETDKWTLSVELKSVNNRYMEISCRMPGVLSPYEQTLRDQLRKRLERGKVYAQVTIKAHKDTELNLQVNVSAIRQIKNMLETVSRESGLNEIVTLDQILKFSEIFETEELDKDNPELKNAFTAAMNQAISEMLAMRKAEGDALVVDIVQRIEELEEGRQIIESKIEMHVTEARQKLSDRIQTLCSDFPVDQERLHTELAVMADKLDVTEECVRLASHHKVFIDTLNKEEVVGKKLNFLLQEMNREVNTICSKAANVEIQHVAVSMKNEIEKIREQVQNLV